MSQPTAPDLDPQDVVEQPDYLPEADPTDAEVIDPDDPSFVEPAANAIRPTATIISGGDR